MCGKYSSPFSQCQCAQNHNESTMNLSTYSLFKEVVDRIVHRARGCPSSKFHPHPTGRILTTFAILDCVSTNRTPLKRTKSREKVLPPKKMLFARDEGWHTPLRARERPGLSTVRSVSIDRAMTGLVGHRADLISMTCTFGGQTPLRVVRRPKFYVRNRRVVVCFRADDPRYKRRHSA